jgi:vacuolar iron transporter family protein
VGAPSASEATGVGPPEAAVRAERLAHQESHLSGSADWLEEAIFGTLDGVITALALVVTLAVVVTADDHTIFLTVMAAAVAGTLSMYVGARLSAQSRADLIRRERAREEWEVDHVPEIERREVEEIYEKQGFTPAEVKLLTDRVTADKKRWVDLMMRDELGLQEEAKVQPGRHAAIIGLSYLLGCGLLALPFLASSSVVGSVAGRGVGSDFLGSMVLGALTLCGVGVLEARFAGRHPLREAAIMVSVGLATAIAVFVVTTLLTPA